MSRGSVQPLSNTFRLQMRVWGAIENRANVRDWITMGNFKTNSAAEFCWEFSLIASTSSWGLGWKWCLHKDSTAHPEGRMCRHTGDSAPSAWCFPSVPITLGFLALKNLTSLLCLLASGACQGDMWLWLSVQQFVRSFTAVWRPDSVFLPGTFVPPLVESHRFTTCSLP